MVYSSHNLFMVLIVTTQIFIVYIEYSFGKKMQRENKVHYSMVLQKYHKETYTTTIISIAPYFDKKNIV